MAVPTRQHAGRHRTLCTKSVYRDAGHSANNAGRSGAAARPRARRTARQRRPSPLPHRSRRRAPGEIAAGGSTTIKLLPNFRFRWKMRALSRRQLAAGRFGRARRSATTGASHARDAPAHATAAPLAGAAAAVLDSTETRVRGAVLRCGAAPGGGASGAGGATHTSGGGGRALQAASSEGRDTGPREGAREGACGGHRHRPRPSPSARARPRPAHRPPRPAHNHHSPATREAPTRATHGRAAAAVREGGRPPPALLPVKARLQFAPRAPHPNQHCQPPSTRPRHSARRAACAAQHRRSTAAAARAQQRRRWRPSRRHPLRPAHCGSATAPPRRCALERATAAQLLVPSSTCSPTQCAFARAAAAARP